MFDGAKVYQKNIPCKYFEENFKENVIFFVFERKNALRMGVLCFFLLVFEVLFVVIAVFLESELAVIL